VSRTTHRGRHRATPPTSALPRIAGTGLSLPTAVAATLVLTASTADLGTNAVDLVGDPATLAAAQTQSQSILTDRQERQDVKINALTTQSRIVQDRAARDNERQKIDAVAQENAERAPEEQMRQANPPVQIAPVPRGPVGGASVGAPPTAPAPDTEAWAPPIGPGFALTSGFGMRWGSMHPGQDFAIPVGTPVKAMSSGTVIFAGWSGGYGNKVEIQYWDGTVSWYAHNSRLMVKTGQAVSPGQVVSLSGNTGHSTGPHLHLEVHPAGGSPVPPVTWLKNTGILP
jgi:murein DD-endopeptidase MepM/ murein hydrolase activator NlpD